MALKEKHYKKRYDLIVGKCMNLKGKCVNDIKQYLSYEMFVRKALQKCMIWWSAESLGGVRSVGNCMEWMEWMNGMTGVNEVNEWNNWSEWSGWNG